MATVRFSKVVSSLPGTLDPDTLYLVRSGAGFDLYCSDATGSIAYLVNAPAAPAQLAYPKRMETPKIVGDVSGSSMPSMTLTAARQYFIPLVVPRAVLLTGFGISVTTAGTDTASIGIYANTPVSGDDAPGNLLASVTGLDTGSSGDKTGSLTYTLQPGTLYWVSLISSSTISVRGLGSGGYQVGLGRSPGGQGPQPVPYLYASGSGSTLPSTAPTSLNAGTGTMPGITLFE